MIPVNQVKMMTLIAEMDNNLMKTLSMILMGAAFLTTLSFQVPLTEKPANDYLPIDTTLEGMELSNSTYQDFDSEIN